MDAPARINPMHVRWYGGVPDAAFNDRGGILVHERVDSPPILGYVAFALSRDLSSTFSIRMRLSVITYAVILAGVLIWCGGILLAPLCTAEGGNAAVPGRALYQVYHPICHQLSDRSIIVAGHPMGVCTRCSSIYFAFLAGTLLFPFFRSLERPSLPPRWVLFLAAVPMLIDASGIGSLFYQVTFLTRAVSGAFFGLVLPFVLLPAALEAAREIVANAHQQKGLTDA
jgi:uncharacterized membrane protein